MMMMMEMVGQITRRVNVFQIHKIVTAYLQILIMMESVMKWNPRNHQDYLD